MSLPRLARSALVAPGKTAAASLTRGLATPTNIPASMLQHVLPPKTPAALHLKTGQSFHGQHFGSKESKFGETVFSTSITSCTFAQSS